MATVWTWWSPGEPTTDLHGFVTRRDRDAYVNGDPGPFRRIVRNHHKLGPVPDDVAAVHAILDEWVSNERPAPKRATN